MKIFKNKQALKAIYRLKEENNTHWFCSNDGCLAQGHLSLIKKHKKNDIVVVSIFVNPTQFDNQEDLENTPKH